MSRIIREHRVYGKDVEVGAYSEEEAKSLAIKGKPDWWAWEAVEIQRGFWSVYIAKHEDAFALND
jgi:hypothetical protein